MLKRALLTSLAIAASGTAQAQDGDAVSRAASGIVADYARTYQVAMFCQAAAGDKMGLQHTVTRWETDLYAAMYLLNRRGVSMQQTEAMVSQFGASALMPSSFYSRQEQQSFCDQAEDQQRAFQGVQDVPLLIGIQSVFE